MIRPEDKNLFEESLRSENPTAQLSDAVRRLIRDFKRSRSEILQELEELRDVLRAEKRNSDEDVVLEVMDFLVGWASPQALIEAGPREGSGHHSINPSPNEWTLCSVRPATSGGPWFNRTQAALFRDLYLPPVTVYRPTTFVLNLVGIIPSPAVLQELILPLAARVRGGALGQQSLVVQTHDQGVSDFISYLARQYDAPIYVSFLGEPLSDARPEGPLTGTLRTTLNVIKDLGGQVSASELAQTVGIEPTAAGNRLNDLADKGYIAKNAQSRQHRFADPRFAKPAGSKTHAA